MPGAKPKNRHNIIDFDHRDAKGVANFAYRRLSRLLKRKNPDIGLTRPPINALHLLEIAYQNRTGRAVIVPAGLPDKELLTQEFGITRFALDDYVFLLTRERYETIGVDEVRQRFQPLIDDLHQAVNLLSS